MADRWQEISRIFHEASAQPPEAREQSSARRAAATSRSSGRCNRHLTGWRPRRLSRRRVPGLRGQAQGFVVELAGGIPKPVCDRCAVYGFLSDGRRVLASWDDARVIGTLDVRNGARVELIRHDEGRLDRPHASPDERWLAFRHVVGPVGQVYVTPLGHGRTAPRTEWQLVDQPTTTGRPAGWSLDSTTMYTLLDTDGFRCVWGQRINPRTRRLSGPVFPARHLHVQMDNGPSTSFSNPVTADGLLYERVARIGDLWRLASTAGGTGD